MTGDHSMETRHNPIAQGASVGNGRDTMTASQHDETVRALSDDYPELPTVQIEGYLDDAKRIIIRATGNSDLIAAENLTRLRIGVLLRAGRA